MINMRSYTVIEKDENDQIVSRSYSSDKDDSMTVMQSSLNEGDNDGELSTMRDRSMLISSPTKEEDILKQKNTTPVINIPHLNIPHKDSPQGGSAESTCPLPPELLPPLIPTPTDHTPNLSPRDHTPKSSPFDHTPSLSLQHFTVSRIPVITDRNSGSSSHDTSPTKSVSKSNNSLISLDTDEWIDDRIEQDDDDQVDLNHVEDEGNDSKEKNDEEGGKWGKTAGVEWSTDGLPLIKIALISRRSRHRAGSVYTYSFIHIQNVYTCTVCEHCTCTCIIIYNCTCVHV